MTIPLPVLEASGLCVRYARSQPRAFATLRAAWVGSFVRRASGAHPESRSQGHAALSDVSLSLLPGEILGVIGRNGAGKSTLLSLLAGVFQPDAGTLVRRGRVGGLLSLGTGFNAELTGRENVRLGAALLGVARARVEAELERVAAFSDLGVFFDEPVRTYSAGMRARLGFAVALLVDPDVVILDEVLRVGDAAFREKAGSLLDRFRGTGKAIVLASHSMEVVARHCDRVLWLDRGRVRAEGAPDEVARAYLEDARREQDRIGAAI